MGWDLVDTTYGIVMVIGQVVAVTTGIAVVVFGAAGAVHEWRFRELRRRQRLSGHPTVPQSGVRRVRRVYDWERDGAA